MDDMTKPIKTVILCLFVAIIGLTWTVGANRAQGESCDFPLELTGIDVTESYYEASRMGQQMNEFTFYEPFSKLQRQLDGSDHPEFIGLFDVSDYWTLVWRTEGGYRVVAGANWDVGTDYQLHSPTCYFYADYRSATPIFGYTEYDVRDYLFNSKKIIVTREIEIND